jgi:hypothetical protein
MNLRALGLVGIGVVMAGCGKPAPVDVAPDASVLGACAGLTVDQIPRVGIYHADLQLEGYETATAFRIDDTASGPVVALGGSVVPVTVAPGSLTAVATSGMNTRTLSLTTVDADCTLHGTYTFCASADCYAYALLGKRTDRLDEPVAHGFTLLGELAGNAGDAWNDVGLAVNVRVKDGLAYLAVYGDGLRIVDVHDPAHLVEVGHQKPDAPDAGEIYNDVKIVDAAAHRYALMASNQVGVVVVDVTAPATPSIVARFGTASQQGRTDVHTLFLDGGKAYLANIDVGLEIWDLADPSKPVRLGTWAHPPTPGQSVFPHDLYVAGARAYVDYWAAGMSIVDVSTPAAPALVGEFAGYGQHTSHSSWVTSVGDRKLAVHGDEQWGAHVHVVDVTEGTPAFGTSIGEYQTRPEVSAHNIMAFGSRAYMAYYQDGVRVLDLSDPAHPTAIAWFDTWPGYDPRYGTSFFEGAVGIDVDLAAGLVYVADSHRGLIVLHLDI